MTFGEYAAGVALSVLALGPVVWGAVRVRARVVPWRGPPARLFEVVLAIATTLAVCEILGAVGLFERTPVVAALAIVGLTLGIVAHGSAGEPVPSQDSAIDAQQTARQKRVALVIAVVAIAIVAGGWSSRTAPAVSSGTTDHDSLWYHLPHAARFYQEGSLTRLHFTDPDFPTAFHPSNSELVHALGMVLFRREVVSPIVNLGWLTLVLLAAWCMGRPWSAGPAAATAAATVLGAPLALLMFAGTANNDIPVVFFLVAALALLAQPGDRLAAHFAAGAAAGLALGTKLTAVVPVVAITAAAIVLWHRRGWRYITVAWVTPLLLTGSYWYVRNLVRVGSPIPGLPLDAGPLPFPSPTFRIVDRFGYSIADYAGNTRVWREWFLPGLRLDFGWAWWLTLALGLAGVILALVRGDRLLRVAGFVAAVGAAGYAITPTTALGPPGSPLLFASNVRYATAALTIAVIALTLAPTLHGRGRSTAVPAVLIVGLVVSQLTAGSAGWGSRAVVGAAVAAAVVVAAAALVALRSRSPLGRWRLPAISVVAGVALAVAAFPAARAHVRDEFRTDPLWSWARDLTGRRIALAGSERQYPLYGIRLDNVVQYVGRREPHGGFTPVADCASWRRSLRAGRYEYVLLSPGRPTADVFGREIPWTESDPAATLLFRTGNARIFRFDASVPDPGC